MSWEDCGFKPGTIQGPTLCPKGACGDCDGEHHFYASFDDEGAEDESRAGVPPHQIDPAMYFECKHCGARAEMVSEDEDQPMPYPTPTP